MEKQNPEDIAFLIHPHMEDDSPELEAVDFRRIEERISMAEEMIETWKGEMDSLFQKQDTGFLKKAFSELSELTDLVDHLYAEWIHMDEMAPDLSKANKKSPDKMNH